LSCILVSSSLFTKFYIFIFQMNNHISYFLVLWEMKEAFKFIFSLLWTFLFGCVLYYFDVVYDLVLIVEYFKEGRWLYFSITLGIVLLPNVIVTIEYMMLIHTLLHYQYSYSWKRQLSSQNFCMNLSQLSMLKK